MQNAGQNSSAPDSLVLTINGGSSSIKFALFRLSEPPELVLGGQVERIGRPGTTLIACDAGGKEIEHRPLEAESHKDAAEELIRWLDARARRASITGIGHRVVHGGMHLMAHQLVTAELVEELRRIQPLDLAHLPRELALIETFRQRFPGIPQVACFDTVFHRDLPRVAQLLPIPRKYFEAGVRRFGFHGLSFSFLLEELERTAGPDAARGRVILAHLGAGASLAAVRERRSIDTTMALTPTAGLVMGTRPGDLDPGLLVYLMRTEGKSPEELDDFISKRCGLIGLSETTQDMRDLLRLRASDQRASDAVEVFCYQGRKWIGAFTAALGGLDTLVFSGGIGEHAPEIRAQICEGLQYLNLRIDPDRNKAGTGLISSDSSTVSVWVIPTNEELVIAEIVARFLRTPDGRVDAF